MHFSWLVRERSAQPGGLPGLYLLKSLIPAFAGLMLLQALAVIGRNILLLTGREDLLSRPEHPPGGAGG